MTAKTGIAERYKTPKNSGELKAALAIRAVRRAYDQKSMENCNAHSVRLTFFRSGARGLHAPTTLPPEPTKHEARKRRASERPRVGCCEELGRSWSRVLLWPHKCCLIRVIA